MSRTTGVGSTCGTLRAMVNPSVPFTDERLPNGLRLIIAEDHLAPVVAVNIWYDVGSKNEVPARPASPTSSST